MSSYDELFHTIDIDHNNELSLAEFTTFCETLPQAPKTNVIQRLFSQADVDDSGFIDLTEFAALCDGVKLLTKMTEVEMVDAYGTSELRRLFQYSCTAGDSMRRDEFRKALDTLNEGLKLRMTNDALATAVRDCPDHVEFQHFKAVVVKVAPRHSLSAIVAAFKEEEHRRKERLSKVKSVFELKREDTSDRRLSSRPAVKTEASAVHADPDGRCANCEALEAELDMILARETQARSTIDGLKKEVQDAKEEAALSEVEAQRKVHACELEIDRQRTAIADLRQELNAVSGSAASRDNQVADLVGSNAILNEEIESLREQLQRADSVRAELDEATQEVKQLQDRLARCQAELQDTRMACSRAESAHADKQVEVEKTIRLMEQLQASKATSDEDSRRVVEEIRRQCADRESSAREKEAHALALKERMEHVERDLNEREDEVTARERRVRQIEAKQRAKWEEKFVTAAKDLDERESRLRDGETELATRNAELQVREQLLEQNSRRAEAISLPERERRLRVLQGIEADLCGRERKLRHAESSYIAKLLDPRIEALKEENSKLREQLDELHAEQDGATTYSHSRPQFSRSGVFAASPPPTNTRGPRTLERSMMSPSFKLL